MSVPKFQAKNKMIVVPHHPYSSHFAVCNYFLFLKLMITLKIRRYNYITMIQAKSRGTLPEFQTHFTKCFEPVAYCIKPQGAYFGQDKYCCYGEINSGQNYVIAPCML
jgi:hypothetical protein